MVNAGVLLLDPQFDAELTEHQNGIVGNVEKRNARDCPAILFPTERTACATQLLPPWEPARELTTLRWKLVKQFVAVGLGCLLLVIAIFVGIMTGWIHLQGRPFQHVRELRPQVEERNQQIQELSRDSHN